MNRRIKKILSLVVAVLMIMSVVPMTSFALTMCDIIGHNVEMVVTKEATCTEAGLKTEKCTRSNCDYSTGITEVIAYKSHTIATIEAVSPTCDKAGNTAGTYCSVCDLIILPCETIPALGHTLVDFPAVQPTCSVNGNNAGKKCSICNEVISGGEPIIASDHDYKQLSYTAGSCKDGTPSTEVKKCKVCGDIKTTAKPAECYFGAWITQSIATCSVNGKMTRTCSECGVTEEKIIEKLSHTWIIEVEKSATCTEPGIATSMKCTVCALVEGRQTIPPLGHKEVIVAGYPAACGKKGLTDGSYCKVCNMELRYQVEIAAFDHIIEIDKTASIKPTCTTEGLRVEQCVRAGCGYINKIVLPKTHGEGLKVVRAATCTEEGRKAGYCRTCNQTVVETIPAMGHDEEVTPGTPADCTLGGVSDGKTCKVCGKITAEPQQTEPLGHDFVVDANTSTPATCEENGFEYLNCSRCNATDRRITVATGHSFDKWKVTVQPTCDKQGEKTRTCVAAGCGKTEMEYIESNGSHDVQIKAAVEPTCTEKGLTQGSYCIKCNEIFEVQEVIPIQGHKMDWFTWVEPTCITDGESVEKCIYCDYASGNSYIIPATGHWLDEIEHIFATCLENGKTVLGCWYCDYTEEIIESAYGHNYKQNWQTIVQPTCTQTGVAIKICKDCFNIETITVDVMSHTDVNFDGKCDMCGITGGSVTEACSCNCHKSGLANMFFKFMLFFQKLFRVNKECQCGKAHY